MERDAGRCFEASSTRKKAGAEKERRYLALYSHSRIFILRIPGWKNLTTVDKAIHINARKQLVEDEGVARSDGR